MYPHAVFVAIFCHLCHRCCPVHRHTCSHCPCCCPHCCPCHPCRCLPCRCRRRCCCRRHPHPHPCPCPHPRSRPCCRRCRCCHHHPRRHCPCHRCHCLCLLHPLSWLLCNLCSQHLFCITWHLGLRWRRFVLVLHLGARGMADRGVNRWSSKCDYDGKKRGRREVVRCCGLGFQWWNCPPSPPPKKVEWLIQ